jgi:predicted MFS family arabinose efflux permease
MSIATLQKPPANLSWNLRQLYWDVIWFGVLAGSTLAFQSVYAARLGASELQIGLISAGPAIVGLAFTLPSGRWLEGKPLIRVSFQSAILQRLGYLFLVALPWLFPSAEGQVWGLIWTTLVMSVAGTVLAISFNAMFAEVVPPEWRGHAVGRRNVLMAVSITVTTILSGQLLDAIVFPKDYQVLFLIGAVGAMMSSFHLGRIRNPDQGGSRTSADNNDDPPPAITIRRKAMVRWDLLAGPFGIFMLSYLAFYAFQYFPIPLFPIAYVDRLHMTDGMIGLGTAFFYGAMMVASFRLGYASTRYGHRKVLVASAALFPIFPFLMAVAKGPTVYFVACLIGGGVNAMLTGALINRLMERVPSNDRPAHMTLHNLALNLGILMGSLLGPLSANLVGLQGSLFLGAGLRLLAAGLFWIWG